MGNSCTARFSMDRGRGNRRAGTFIFIALTAVEGAVGYRIYRYVSVNFEDRVEKRWMEWPHVEQEEGIIRARIATLDDLSSPSGRNFAVATVVVENGEEVESEKVAVVVRLPTFLQRIGWGEIKRRVKWKAMF